jgi:hypothetical protein
MASATLIQQYESVLTEADLQRFIDESVTEGLYLEFKEKQDTRIPDLSDGDKANFSKALSDSPTRTAAS